jgi:hypothetical protein
MRLWHCCCSPSSPARTGDISGPTLSGMPPTKQHQSRNNDADVCITVPPAEPPAKRTSFSDDVIAPRAQGAGLQKAPSRQMRRNSSKRAKQRKDSRFDEALQAEQDRSRAVHDEIGHDVGVHGIHRSSSTRSSRLTSSQGLWSSRRSGEAKSSRFSQALADAEGSWRMSDQSRRGSSGLPVHKTQGQAAAELWMR